MPRAVLLVIGLFVLLVPSVAHPAAVAAQQGDITVQLFAAQPVAAVTISPASSAATLRICPACPEKLLPPSTEISAKKNDEGNDWSLLLIGKKFASSAKAEIEIQGRIHLAATQAGQEPLPITAAGQWKIAVRHGSLLILFTLPTERYVAAALAGEAAPDEPAESLRAMAVIIRTFALENLRRHAAGGFNLCDDTHCQVLKWDRSRPEIEQAVLDTTGETLWPGNEPGNEPGNNPAALRASVYYTQHCGGQTESASSVWPAGKQPYLPSHPDPYCLRTSPARWHVGIAVDRALRIMQQQGWRVPPRLESIRILSRTASGRAQLLEIAGSGQHTQVSASSLRYALDRELGWNQLRSDWFEVTLSNGILHFDGKGYGHGVGLCQAGAREMAFEHKSAAEILSFYFPGTHIGIAPTDRGWTQTIAQGWTLSAVASSPSGSVVREGNQAWARAQQLLPGSPSISPRVYQFPSTELFRQATGEPGWVRASTRVSPQTVQIFLQPASVLAHEGSAEQTMLHEFLHALIEAQASTKAPLWLREGLAEALADPKGSPDAKPIRPTTPASLDVALANRIHSTTASQAQRQSAALVRGLIAQRGLPTVRAWLQNGVPAQILTQLSPAPRQP